MIRAVGRWTAPIGLIAAMALGYFVSLVVHPTSTLYADHSDLIALHVPWEMFLGRSWRETGERPLWNPLQFAGLPFAHDIQASIFYPPHLIFRYLDERLVGPGLSWLIVAHVMIAGWGMYAYARATGLRVTSSMVAAVGFMFAGKWLIHLTLAGHYAFAALAWLPWIALGLHLSIQRRSPLLAAWAGVPLGLMAMASHPQIPLYSGMFLAVWTLVFASRNANRDVDERKSLGHDIGIMGVSTVGVPLVACPPVRYTLDIRTGGQATSGTPKASQRGNISPSKARPDLVCWIVAGLIAGGIGFGVAAIQLLPSLEAVPLSSRGISGIPESPSLSLRSFLRAFGPSPGGVVPVVSWEPRSGFGVVWVALALMAPVLSSGRNRFRARWGLLIFAAMTVFALGGAIVFQAIPLFRMFRQPSRMFLIAALPLAYLAALTTDALLDPTRSTDAAIRKSRSILTWTSVAALTILTVAALSSRPIVPHPYWFSLALTIPITWRLLGTDPRSRPILWRVAWVVALLVDLVAQTWPHVQTRPLDDVLAPSPIAVAVASRALPLDRVLDRSLSAHQSSTPLGPAVATLLNLNQTRGYNALDIARYKDYIAIVADPIRVPQPYNGLTNVPIRYPALLDILGVRWLVQPTDSALRPQDDSGVQFWRVVATDPGPRAFTFAVGGVQTLPPYELRQNPDAFPRAFVVPEVGRLPESRAAILDAMTSTDFRRVALVEGPNPLRIEPGEGGFRPASIRSYQPNEITIDAEGPGLLVLADPWYPGWIADVDGAETPIQRVDTLFRGVALAPGSHRIRFAFRPRSVATGARWSGITLAALIAWTLLRLASVSRTYRLRALRKSDVLH